MSDVLDRLRKALADRYSIVREIGSGGMATVYQAQDLKHERLVAMKVLRPELAAALGPDRFLQEIKIAASLHHPHILALYDSGEADGFLYYVMPYVEGESLRDRLGREKQLAIDDALQIAREVADALSYAHAHGVIHRDIKPENILLESGHAVVADFGIARAVDVAGGERLTETGIAIGTPTYMSPEQAGGEKDLDGRSDLYSLGCVLHEMLAGQPPFTGPTVESLVHQHLSVEPQSVTVVRPSVPGWVAAALERSLAKTPADRFNPVALFGEAIAPRASVAGDTHRVTVTGRKRWLVPGIPGATLVAVVAVVLLRVMASHPTSITVSNIDRVTTDPGVEMQPAISPDGSEVAYVSGSIEAPRLVVRSTIEIGGSGETYLGDEAAGGQWSPAWKPDGASVRFLACAMRVRTDCEWQETGSRGGPARTASVPREFINPAWSTDGTRVAGMVGDGVYVYSAGDPEPELLGRLMSRVGWGRPHSLAWSPDGQRIAYVFGNPQWRTGANVLNASIWIQEAAGGEPIQVTDDTTMNVSPQWLPDSRHLLFVSNRDGPRGIYVVEVGPNGPQGDPQTVLPSSDAHSISVSADGSRLAYADFTVKQNIWSIPIPRSGPVSIRDAVPVTTGSQVIEMPALSTDGAWIVFESDRRGEFDIYKMPLAGGDPQLVADISGIEFAPDLSPDGTEIAYYGEGGTWVSVDGGTPELVGVDGSWPDWSPDGLTIGFQALGPQGVVPDHIWTASRDSVGAPWSDPVLLTDFGCGVPDWAPDGASLVCDAGTELTRVSRDGVVLWRVTMTPGVTDILLPQFSPDGSRIYFVVIHEDRSQSVCWIPATGGDATEVVTFDDPLLIPYGMAVGSGTLYFTLSEYESDIYVMDLEW